ncbi:MAG: flagellar protein FlaG [Burkholderiales bacterium]|nr:flagellar protein FlaG [Burkholderiales bacterium]
MTTQAADFQFQPSAGPAVANAAATATTAATAAATANASLQQSQAEPTLDQLRQAVNQINQEIQFANKDIKFSLDNQSGRVVVKVMDTQTNEVIRQIPSKEMLAIADAMGKLQGLIVQQKA